VNILRLDALLEEKANDHSLLDPRETWQNTKSPQQSSENGIIFIIRVNEMGV
jgi:hypothetical protein